MFDNLKAYSPEQRRKLVPILPFGWNYFRRWRSARWFLTLLMPIAGSLVAAGVHGRQWWEIGILAALGIAVTIDLFLTTASGVSASNFGMYFRDREPVRYWRDVAIIGIAYFAIAVAGHVS